MILKTTEKQNADRDDAARKEKQKTGREKTPKAPSANPKMMQESGTILPSSTTSTAGSTTKLSPLQVLESIFPNQAVSRGIWDSATYPPKSKLKLIKRNQQVDAAAIEDNWSSNSD
ncbi:hypothetical protein V6N13_088583 [Hibiscus sabdariffa]